MKNIPKILLMTMLSAGCGSNFSRIETKYEDTSRVISVEKGDIDDVFAEDSYRFALKQQFSPNGNVICEQFWYEVGYPKYRLAASDGCYGTKLDGKLDKLILVTDNTKYELTREKSYSLHKDVFDKADENFASMRNLYAKHLTPVKH